MLFGSGNAAFVFCILLDNHKKVHYVGLSAILPMILQECLAYKMKSSEMKKQCAECGRSDLIRLPSGDKF